MTRPETERIADILAAIQACRTYRPFLEEEDSRLAEMALDAVLRNLAVIGEAVNHLPTDVTARHPEVDWRAVVGMRHVLVHQYFDINVSVVLDVVDQELTPLEEALIKTRRAEGGSPN